MLMAARISQALLDFEMGRDHVPDICSGNDYLTPNEQMAVSGVDEDDDQLVILLIVILLIVTLQIVTVVVR